MEQEMLFTASKWEIFKLLSDKPLSPIELAKHSNTSIANVSQQLRLLEIAGLVKSERISNRDRGQPRILYSLSGNNGYLISTSNEFVEKKLIKLSAHNQIIIKIWFYQDKEAHYFLEKGFWKIEEHLKEIDGIAIDESSSNPLNLVIFTRNKDLSKKLKHIKISNPIHSFNKKNSRQLFFITTDTDKVSKELTRIPLCSLYDPEGVIAKLNELTKTN